MRVRIKPFKRPPAPPADLYDTTIKSLLSATRSILHQKPALRGSTSSPAHPIIIRPATQTQTLPPPSRASSISPRAASPKSIRNPPSSESTPKVQSNCYVSREELYRSVQDLCVHGHSARLYRDVMSVVEEGALVCLHRLLKLDVPVEAGEKGVYFSCLPSLAISVHVLNGVRGVFEDYVEYLGFVRSIFLYLDRSWALPQGSGKGIKSLWDAGIDIFRALVILGNGEGTFSVAECAVHSVLHQIRRERNGEAVDRVLLRSNIRMFVELPTLYGGIFLPQFMAQSVSYFEMEGREWTMNLAKGVSAFLKHIEKRLSQAADMGLYYLPSTVSVGKEPLLVSVVEKYLLLPHVESFLLAPHNLHPLLNSDHNKISPQNTSDLHILYLHLRRVNKLDQLKIAWIAHAKLTGQALTTTPDIAQQKLIIPLMLQFKTHLHTTCQNAYLSLPLFQNSIKGILEDVLNSSENSSRLIAELLAKHVSNKLKSHTIFSDNEAELFLLQVLGLFRHVSSKDVFEAFYRKDLAKRLLLSKSASVDLEKNFLSKLKTECGAGYTSKMEGMFQDMELSRDVMMTFRASSRGKRMEVQVLTTGYWPVYPQLPVKLPTHLGQFKEQFEHYYDEKYQGRRITWQHSLGNCIVNANFLKGKKELVVGQYQTIVLLSCFNNTNKIGWTVTQVMEQTGINNRGECERVLLSLSMGKDGTRVLHKLDHDHSLHPKKKTRKSITDHDLFLFNEDFESKQHRIKITSIQMKETEQERTKTHETVSRDRLYLIDAALVRIMKARKTIDHQTLLAEVMNQVRFSCTGTDVKKRIESLIERDYMERVEGCVGRYNYLA